ncbi:MAG TPA: cell surface protein SprA [bacterium]|nr:cell surface protein SprA [bacterium]
MISHQFTRSKKVLIAVFSIIFIAASPCAEMGFRLPGLWKPVSSLDLFQRPSLLSLWPPHEYTHVLIPRSLNRSVEFDSLSVLLSLKSGPVFLERPIGLSLDDFSQYQIERRSSLLWQEHARSHVLPESRGPAASGLTLESPRIRSEAFRRAFGGDRLSLRVDGNITIDGGMRNETRSQKQTADNRRPNTSFQMKQTQRFHVQGKIGERVSIFVDQDSERPFEFENAVKLEYRGDEDAIIQSIEAGNVSLSLPSTRFVTFSTQNSGLFGIKSQFKIGNLDLTAIASMQKGEKKKKSFKGGKEDQLIQIQDYEYRRHTYFFVDYFYRDQFPNYDESGKHIIDPSRIVTDIEVYKSGANYKLQDGSIRAWATRTGEPDTLNLDDEETYKGYFLRLNPLDDYFIQPELGYIYMNTPLQEGEILAVAFRDTSGNQAGSFISGLADTSQAPVFKMIKPRTPRPADYTWNLEWKNVYSLGIRDITQEEFDEGLEVNIYFKSTDGDPKLSTQVNGKTVSYLELFGLDRFDKNGRPNPDGAIDNNPNIINKRRGELIFPDLKPFDPTDPQSPLPEAQRTPALYDTTNTNYIHQQSKFYLEVKSSRRSTSFNLDMNIIEGTEEVYLDGVRMTKDVDYTIDYMFGSLTMLNPNASNPNAEIEINYESQQLFTIDKKSLLGARAEYTLWETGNRRSFIGGTFLYMNQRILERRIRVGKEAPMENMVWDVNTALYFEPAFLTRALDALPIIQASAPSTISIEGEIAQIIPNPNTLNSRSTGDRDGVAYLDDFESARRQTSLGVMRKNWSMASQPLKDENTPHSLLARGHLIWYNPIEMVPIRDIWPNRETTTNYGGSNQVQVLTLEFTPNPTITKTRESWGGIMRFLPTGYADQTDSRFLEIWVRGTRGRLHVDLGQISEDVIPNGRLDTEDKATDTEIQNNLLDIGEDTGLDGMMGDDPPSLFHPHEDAYVVYEQMDGRRVARGIPYDFWDLNGDGIKQPNEPWSYDDFKYQNRSNVYDQINGTEGNINDGTQTPDTEDLNGNGDVDLSNNYFEYSLSLELQHPDTSLIVGGIKDENGDYPEDGWRLYRIPLESGRTIKNPDMSRIEYARIWIDSLDRKTSVSIAEINLTSNEWKPRGVRSELDSTFFSGDDSTMTLAVINTHDNPDYTPPEGVRGELDPVQKIRSKEQSLVIHLNNLAPGYEAIAQKQFFQPQDLIQYRSLKMFLHGGGSDHIIGSDSIEFFLQWGSDTEGEVYYETRISQVQDGWKENDIEVSFDDLSRMKIKMLRDSLNTLDSTLTHRQRLRIRGKPSLRNIRWLIIGVKNKGLAPFSGELWINELRVSGVQKDKGMAMRLRADVALSDFISLSAEYQRTDADFHTVTERVGSGSHSQSTNINANMKLEKILPASWGLSIPVTATFSNTMQTPKYFPNSDILVSPKTADEDFLEQIRTRNTSKALNVSISKRTRSQGGLFRLLVDPWAGKFNYTRIDQSNSQIEAAGETRWQGNINYSLSIGKDHYLEPFSWLGKSGLLKSLASARFYYLPGKFDFQAEAKDIGKNTEYRDGRADTVKTALFTRNISTGFSPFSALNFDFSRIYRSDMQEEGLSQWDQLFASLSPGRARSQAQQFGTSFNPKIASWLTNNFKYTANYQWENNPQIQESGNSARVNSNLTLSGTLNFKTLVQSLKSKPGAREQGPRQPVTRQRPADEKADTEDPKQEEGRSVLTSILSSIGSMMEKLDPISINIRESKTDAQYGILDNEAPSFAYMIGWDLDPGVKTADDVSTDQSSEKTERSVTLGTGFRIFSGLSASIDYSLSNAQTLSTQKTGNRSSSTLNIGDEGSIPFPNWTVQWQGLEKIPLFNKVFRSISINHRYSGKHTQTWSGSSQQITQETFSSDFRPFLGVNMTFLNGISANFNYSLSENLTVQKTSGLDQRLQTSEDISLTARYSMKQGIRLPFLKNKLENNIDFNLSFSMKNNKTERKTEDKKGYTTMSSTDSWSLQPRIDYTFSQTVRGGLSFELGERNDQRMGKTQIKAFNLHAAISLSGR